MHMKGVVHRDMNPINVLIKDATELKIIDFNVSKLADSKSRINEEGSKFKYSIFTKTGTPIYTAPEMHSSFRYTESIDTVSYTHLTLPTICSV